MTDWTTHRIQQECYRRGRWVSAEWIRSNCRNGLIPGARKLEGGRDWLIPEESAREWVEEYVKKGKRK